MTVWVLWVGQWEPMIHGIYSAQEIAEAVRVERRIAKKNSWIEEFTVDESRL